MILNIEVVSDVICPWCFVAKRRLEQAIEDVRDRYEFRTAWHPFQLNPTIPAEGIERRIYRTAKFGCWEHSRALDMRLVEVGKSVGIDFAFDQIQWTPNTFDAHRLIWLAQQESVQEYMVEALFRAYFEQGQNIGDRQILTEIALKSGIDDKRLMQFWNTDDGSTAVNDEEAAARRLGISSVPYIIINGKYSLSGAQDSQTIVSAFDQVNQLTMVEH
ncbi:MAG TPA: DsbA family oxidoreductase [Elainellaceae cyanobacterium]